MSIDLSEFVLLRKKNVDLYFSKSQIAVVFFSDALQSVQYECITLDVFQFLSFDFFIFFQVNTETFYGILTKKSDICRFS